LVPVSTILLLNGENHVEAKCICEISQYGVILVENNELLESETCGFLLRIKPENENEGGIMPESAPYAQWSFNDMHQLIIHNPVK
jgi:hypothetical protein